MVASSRRVDPRGLSQRSQKDTERPFRDLRLCLSPQGKPPPLFLMSSSAGYPRGHKSRTQKGTEAPFWVSRLMLVGVRATRLRFSWCPAPAVDPRGHKSRTQKGTERLSGYSPYACRVRATRLRFSWCPSSGGFDPRGHKSRTQKAHRTPSGSRLMLVGQGDPPALFCV